MNITDEPELRPRLLQEILIDTEYKVCGTLLQLRQRFPSYRDDQLFIFWLGRLSEGGVDIHNFNSTVSFTE